MNNQSHRTPLQNPAQPNVPYLLARGRLAAVGTVAALMLAGCSSAFFGVLNSGLDGRAPQSVEFAPEHALALDVFRPRAGAYPAPVVVFFYGGSWQDGERADYRFVGDALASEGMLVVIPDYRKYPEVRFPDFMDDAAAAVAWARREAPRLGGDPERIILAGHSAGAHIAALLATDERYLEGVDVPASAIAGLVGLAGAYDFLPSDDEALQAIFGTEPDEQARSQPVNFVAGDEAPALLIHGDDDRLVLPRNSRHFAEVLRAHGVTVEHRTVDGVGHIRLLAGLRDERLADVLEPMVDFIGQAASDPGTP